MSELRVFGTCLLSKMFGRKSKDATGNWRRLHGEERRNLYSLHVLG